MCNLNPFVYTKHGLSLEEHSLSYDEYFATLQQKIEVTDWSNLSRDLGFDFNLVESIKHQLRIPDTFLQSDAASLSLRQATDWFDEHVGRNFLVHSCAW